MPLPTLPAATADDAAPSCTLGYVQKLLGTVTMSDERAARYVQALVDEHSFPAPFPTFLRNNRTTLDVHPRSRWNRAAVDAWFEGYVPPSAAAHIDARAMAEAGKAMDANAANLRLVGGRDMERGA